jgi:hypothetical protein
MAAHIQVHSSVWSHVTHSPKRAVVAAKSFHDRVNYTTHILVPYGMFRDVLTAVKTLVKILI